MKAGKQLHLFIVDDNKMFLDSLDYQVKKKFGESIIINKYLSGEECLKSIREQPDVIILDYMLDGKNNGQMNGIEVLKRIKQLNRKIFVLMLSGQDRIDVAVDTIKYDAFDYIVKNESAFMKVIITLNIIKKELSLAWKLKQWKKSMLIFIILFVLACAGFIIVNQVFHIT